MGVFFANMLSSGLNMLGVPFAMHQFANRLILIIAVGADAALPVVEADTDEPAR